MASAASSAMSGPAVSSRSPAAPLSESVTQARDRPRHRVRAFTGPAGMPPPNSPAKTSAIRQARSAPSAPGSQTWPRSRSRSRPWPSARICPARGAGEPPGCEDHRQGPRPEPGPGGSRPAGRCEARKREIRVRSRSCLPSPGQSTMNSRAPTSVRDWWALGLVGHLVAHARGQGEGPPVLQGGFPAALPGSRARAPCGTSGRPHTRANTPPPGPGCGSARPRKSGCATGPCPWSPRVPSAPPGSQSTRRRGMSFINMVLSPLPEQPGRSPARKMLVKVRLPPMTSTGWSSRSALRRSMR